MSVIAAEATEVKEKLKGHIVMVGAIASIVGIFFLIESKRQQPTAPNTPASPPLSGGGGSSVDAGLLQQILDGIKNQPTVSQLGSSIDLTFTTDNGVSGGETLGGFSATQSGASTVSSSSSSSSGSDGLRVGYGGFSLGYSGNSSGSNSNNSGVQTGSSAGNSYGGTTSATYTDKGGFAVKGSGLSAEALATLLGFLSNTAGSYAQRTTQQNANATHLADQTNQLGQQTAGLQKGGPVQQVNNGGTPPDYTKIQPQAGTPSHHNPGYTFTGYAVDPTQKILRKAIFVVTKRNSTGHDDGESQFLSWV